MNPLDPHNQLEEHIRDSAPDNSRFDGFDRGDDAREVDPGYTGLEASFEATPRRPRKPGIAMQLLASLGWLGGLPSQLSNALGLSGQMPTAIVPAHEASKLRKAQRKLCKRVGRRQYRRMTRTAYALRDDPWLPA